MTIDIGPIINILIYYIFPLGFGIVLGLFIYVAYILKTMPLAAFVLRKAARTQKGVLTILADDAGKLRFDLMSMHIGQGILCGDEVNYLFTPRPTYEIPKQAVLSEDESGKQRIEVTELELSEAEKANIDELNLHKHHMVGIQVPVLIGYAGKSVVATPKMLNYLKEVDEAGRVIDEKLKNEKVPEAGMEEARKKEFKLINLLDPRIYKKYVKWTLGPAIIDALCLTHEMIGAEQIEKPAGIGRYWPVALLVVIVIVAIVVYQSGILTTITGGAT